jgi:hypothetical protein
MASNAVVAEGVAGDCRMGHIPCIPSDEVPVAFREPSPRISLSEN